MKEYLATILIVVSLVILTGCGDYSTVPPTQTSEVFSDGNETMSRMPTLPVSISTASPTVEKKQFPADTVQPTLPPSRISTSTTWPTQVLSPELIINSGLPTGVLFLGKDGSIIKRLSEGYELSAVPGASYLYRVHSFDEGRGIQVDRIDFDWNVIDARIISMEENYRHFSNFNYSVSPDGKWITYMSGDNDYDPRLSENIELWMLNADQKDGKPLLVTKNRRSSYLPVPWTETGDLFAYADMDESGIVQLFEMNPNSQKTIQITHFDESFRGQRIYQAKLSPDGDKIAFTTQIHRGIDKIGVIDVDSQECTWMQIPSGYETQNDPLWWGQSGGRIMVLISGTGVKNVNDFRIVWYDVTSGNPTLSFPENGERFPYDIQHIFPLGDIDVVGFWGYEADISRNQYWLYDSKNTDLKKIDLPDLELTPFRIIQLKN